MQLRDSSTLSIATPHESRSTQMGSSNVPLGPPPQQRSRLPSLFLFHCFVALAPHLVVAMPVVKASATVGRHWTTCAELRLNSLKGSFTFVLEGSTRKITWTDAVSPIKVVSAAFVVTWYTQSSTEVPDGQCDLAEALWPSTSAGAISLPASSHTDDYYSRHTLSVVIVTPDDGLFSWERRIEQESKAAAVHCAGAPRSSSPLSRRD